MDLLDHLELDRPIKTEDEDNLHYVSYAEVLKEILDKNTQQNSNCSHPCGKIIGLFSEFGAGKSSVITLLKNKISKGESKSLPVHVDSVWNYQSIDILKKILIKTDENKTKPLNLDYRKTLNTETTEINKRFYYLNLFVFVILAVVLILGIYNLLNSNIFEGKKISEHLFMLLLA